MATVTGLTAARMLEIEAQSVIDGTVDVNGHLQLTTHGGEVIDAGKVKGDKGEPGSAGPAGPVTTPAPDPIAPTALTVLSNTGFYTPTGQPISTVVFSWNPVLLDVIGDVPAIDRYELWYREAATTAILLDTSETTTLTTEKLSPGLSYLVKVRAHTFQGGWGAFSPEIPVTAAVPSSLVPNEPGNVTIITNVGQFRSDGRAEAILNLIWDAVTESVDGAPISIQTYEIWMTTEGGSTPILLTPETSVFLSFPSGSSVELQVKAMSTFGIWSELSESDIVTTEFPPANNNPATIPTLTTNMGVVYSSWDGNLSTGPIGLDFYQLVTEVGPSGTGPWTATGIPAVSAGQTAIIPSSPGSVVWVRFKWRDKLGRVSTGISPVASIEVLGIEQQDLSEDLAAALDSLENAVISVITEYAVNDSETVPPVSGWSTATPERTPGTFVWMRTTTNYADESQTVSNPVLITGNTGSTGAPGTPGTAGKGISSTAVTYQVNSNGTTAPTGTWVASPPATSPGQFLWTRTITTYTDATTTTAYSVAAHGANGSNGAPGVGIASTAVTYQVHNSGTIAPTGTWLASPAATSPGQFLWTRTVTTYTDASNSTAYSVAAHGATGATGTQGSQGIQGPPGTNGQPTYTWIKYADTPTTGMSDSPTGKVYMGIAYNKLTATESSTYSDYEWSLIKGADGEDGKGISSTAVTYQAHSNGTTAPTGTWLSSPPATTPGQYLWTRTVTTYTDATNSTAYSVAVHGATGSTGAAGKGISSTAVTYQVHSNGITAPTGTWQSTPQATSPGQFLWVRTVTTYTDATTTTAYAVSAHGQTGAQGIQGPVGANGSPTYTWIKYATSATGTGISDDPTGKTYIGIAYNKTTPTESTTPGDYAWSLIQGPQGNQGIQGPAGADGTERYTWIKYADTPTTGMSDNPSGKIYMGIAYNKTTATESTNYADYDWSLIQGPQGSTGATGKGISSTAVTYQVHSNGITAPTGTWQSTPQATSVGQFLWTRTITTYTDATTSTAYSVAAHGSTGPTGSTGATGKGISSTAVTYQVHSNGTTAPTGTWQASPQATTPGQYLWTRTITTYTDATTTTAYAVAAHGAQGSQGIQGPPGANGQPTYTWIKYGTSAAGAGMSDDPTGKTYMGIAYNKTTATESSNPADYEWSLIQGPQGNTGAAGKGISTTTVTYQVHTNGTTAPTGTWTVSPGTTAPGQFLWTRTVLTYTDATTVTVYSVAAHGATGSTGSPGAAGTDATNVIVGNDAVAIPTNPSGTTTSTHVLTIPFSGWVGNARAAATVVVSGLPSGITVGTNTPATTGADGSLILNVANASTLGGGTNGEITLTITCNSKTFVQKFSWAKAPQGATGSTGSTGSPGAAATSIDVGNEAVVIPCTSAGATVNASTVTIPFTGFVGNVRAAATVVVSGLPTGITVQTNTAGTSGAAGSLVLAVASASTLGGSTSGNITLTITCNSLTFVQSFTWSKAVAGASGSTGGVGPAGKGISSITSYYQQVTTGSDAPAAPIYNPPEDEAWKIFEPDYISSTELYRAELYVFTDATFGWSTVSKVSSYTAATQAVTVANLADAAAHGMIKASSTDPGQSVGRIWLQLDGSTGEVIGVKISNGSVWTTYRLMADSILVPSSVGTISIGDGAVVTPKLDAIEIWGNEAWLNVLRAGVIETAMVTPTFGDSLNLSANHDVTIIAGRVDSQGDTINVISEDLDDLDNTVNGEDGIGEIASKALGTANTAKTTADTAKTTADTAAQDLSDMVQVYAFTNEGAFISAPDSAFEFIIQNTGAKITENSVVRSEWLGETFMVKTIKLRNEEGANIELPYHKIERYDQAGIVGTIIRSV